MEEGFRWNKSNWWEARFVPAIRKTAEDDDDDEDEKDSGVTLKRDTAMKGLQIECVFSDRQREVSLIPSGRIALLDVSRAETLG